MQRLLVHLFARVLLIHDKPPLTFRYTSLCSDARTVSPFALCPIAQQSLSSEAEPPVPSLFSFHIDDPLLAGLPGMSVSNVSVSAPQTKLAPREGPILITHEGLSGPAILKLSAFGARDFHAMDYRFEILVNWLRDKPAAHAQEALRAHKQSHARKRPVNACPFELPLRLGRSLADAANIDDDAQWSQISKTALEALAEQCVRCRLNVDGKSMNKEEFVTAAGFNFQAAWTTGHGRIAGTAAGDISSPRLDAKSTPS